MRRSSLVPAVCAVAATVLAAFAVEIATAAAPLYSRGSEVAYLRGDAVSLRAAPRSNRVLARISVRTSFGSPSSLGVVTRRGGWVTVISTALPNGLHGYLRRTEVGLRRHPYVVEVDRSDRLATVWRWGVRVRRFPVAVGTLATPTPVGRFTITDKLWNFVPSVYGCCVLALSGHQAQLPAGWQGGDRLAIHGGGGLGAGVSNGCLHARTADLYYLMRRLPLGTQVVIHP
jgi:lipoprotein-anchoring transpeptidase ErfK/SrfK